MLFSSVLSKRGSALLLKIIIASIRGPTSSGTRAEQGSRFCAARFASVYEPSGQFNRIRRISTTLVKALQRFAEHSGRDPSPNLVNAAPRGRVLETFQPMGGHRSL